MTITFRKYRNEDFKYLENIVRETWHYDEFCNPETAHKLARVFLSSCLAKHTFSCVAVHNDIPIGIILVDNRQKNGTRLKLKLQQIKSIISLFVSKEGRTVSKIFESVNGIDKELLKECGDDYPAEVVLFAVNSSFRGKGVGKQLFQSALDYISDEKLDSFYLFTDTSCNFGFYEHSGMTRKVERKHDFNVKGQKSTINFFIYDYKLSL